MGSCTFAIGGTKSVFKGGIRGAKSWSSVGKGALSICPLFPNLLTMKSMFVGTLVTWMGPIAPDADMGVLTFVPFAHPHLVVSASV
jgi:hypothetical protein